MIYAVSIATLVAILVVGTLTPINIGVSAFAAAFIVGYWSTELTINDIIAFFPENIVVILLGITVLFGVARCNGTVDLLVSWALHLMRGRRWALAWLMFVLGAVLMTLGAVLALAILAPIAMPIAARYRIDPLLMGMMTCHGAVGAAFSPITVYGAFANGWLESVGVPTDPLLLYFIPLVLNFLMALGLFLVRGRHLLRSCPMGTLSDGRSATDSQLAVEALVRDHRLTPLRAATLVGLVTLLIGAAAFTINVGAFSLIIAAVLLLVGPKAHASAIEHVPWPVILLVSGVLTYMSVLQANGTITYLGSLANSLTSPVLTLLVLCIAAAVMSSVASSLATLGIVLPLAAAILESHPVSAVALVAALCFAALVADISPVTTNGAMIISFASVPNRQSFQRSMLKYTGYVVLTAPVFAWFVVVLPITV